jgi:hypothetical protein
MREQKSLNHMRVADIEIDAPIEEVACLWQNQNERASWDSSVLSAKIISPSARDSGSAESSASVVRLVGRPGYLLPARDYVFKMLKAPAGLVGLNDFRAVCFFGIDSPASLTKSWFYVRGNMNHIMLLRPIGSKTLVTYIVEFSYNGILVRVIYSTIIVINC